MLIEWIGIVDVWMIGCGMYWFEICILLFIVMLLFGLVVLGVVCCVLVFVVDVLL